MKKLLAVGVIVLFLGVAFAPSTGTKVEEKTSVSDVSNAGVDIGIVEIVAYDWCDSPILGFDLCFTPKIKNFGDTPYDGGNDDIDGISRYLITGRVFDTSWHTTRGDLAPGESWYAWDGHGIKYPFPFQFPRLYRIKFTISPTDSNPDNNHFEQVFLIWGFFKSHYICIPFI